MRDNALLVLCLAAILLAGVAGCASAPVIQTTPEAPSAAPSTGGNPDHAKLKNALTGGQMTPPEVADMSDRLLTPGNEVTDQDMARLELLLLTAIKSPDKSAHAALWRSLGILHYNQQKYKQARQELQTSNEINPKSAKTHYYLARLFVHQGAIYERQGLQGKSRQQFKRADIEMEQARKIEPSNQLFRQDVKQMIGRE